MKVAFSLTLLFVPLALVQAQKETVHLPHQIVAILDSEYQTWTFVDNFAVLKEPVLEPMGLDTSQCQPNFVWGDFDGDGNRDYAVYIQHHQESGENKRLIIAFLRRGNLYQQHLLKGGSDFIWLVRKGTRQFDFDTGKYFRQKHDAIIDVTIEKGATTYVYEGGTFKEVVTSD